MPCSDNTPIIGRGTIAKAQPMKKGFYCPKCGNLEAIKLLVTSHTGKSLSMHLASQAAIYKPGVQISCLICKHAGRVEEFRKGRAS